MKKALGFAGLLVCLFLIGCAAQNIDEASDSYALEDSVVSQSSEAFIGAVNTASRQMKTAQAEGMEWFLVATEGDLRAIGTSSAYPLSGNYLLDRDITLSKEVDWIPIGTEEAPFTGVFNGNGCEIIDLAIKDANTNPIGTFAYCDGAEICNVTLRNPDYMSAYQSGDSIAPFVVFGCNNTLSYNNQIVDLVE